MTALDQQTLIRENAYLKQRCAQLQDDMTGLSAELHRVRQQLEHASNRRHSASAPDPLSGGQ